ncbi:hypothetical protein GCM10009747_31320 [Agromyces humatus]|uniref:Uncharacterized protein n=1 Tax=Agromyces humatus TaxID=279573 RepID=A0ABN2KYG3_9MICO
MTGYWSIPELENVYLEDSWVLSKGAHPAVDATGQPDFGSLDEFGVEGASYRLSGNFGLVAFESDLPTLELTE